MAAERLQKILARAGIASRRKAEALIVAGRVRVGGRTVSELGARADARRDRIEVDGKRIMPEPLQYVVLNKPRGVVCTMRDPEGRTTVADLVSGAGARLLPVGRLDYSTSGALLMTNDGDFSMKLLHPKHGTAKEYVAKVRGRVDDDAIERWRKSLVIDGKSTRPADVRRLRFEGDKTWLQITLKEGRNRQIRRLGDAAGHPVMRLSRLSFAGVDTEGLSPGRWRPLSVDELKALKRAYGVPHRIVASVSRPTTKSGGSPKRRSESRGSRESARATRPRRRTKPKGRASKARRVRSR